MVQRNPEMLSQVMGTGCDGTVNQSRYSSKNKLAFARGFMRLIHSTHIIRNRLGVAHLLRDLDISTSLITPYSAENFTHLRSGK